MLSTISKKAQRLKSFIEAASIMESEGFPVKIQAPIYFSVKAEVTFNEFHLVSVDSSLL